MRCMHAAAALALTLGASAALAQPVFDGWLCCNLRTDGSWISDINYAENGKRVLAVGTPVQITGYGRQRVHVLVNGEKHSIGNDYSRDLSLQQFAERYVVRQDPAAALARAPAKVRKAIESMRITPGMTREQVLMSVGYPVSSENPHLDADTWRYWLSSFAEFQVLFGKDGRVKAIETDAMTRNRVVLD